MLKKYDYITNNMGIDSDESDEGNPDEKISNEENSNQKIEYKKLF